MQNLNKVPWILQLFCIPQNSAVPAVKDTTINSCWHTMNETSSDNNLQLKLEEPKTIVLFLND